MEFADLVNFIEEKTILKIDPIIIDALIIDALDSFTDKAQRPDHKNRGVKTWGDDRKKKETQLCNR